MAAGRDGTPTDGPSAGLQAAGGASSSDPDKRESGAEQPGASVSAHAGAPGAHRPSSGAAQAGAAPAGAGASDRAAPAGEPPPAPESGEAAGIGRAASPNPVQGAEGPGRAAAEPESAAVAALRVELAALAEKEREEARPMCS